MRIGRLILFTLAGLITGGLGGLLLPSFHERIIESLDFRALAHLALLGALMAVAGPLVERHWRKLIVSFIVGGVTLVALALAVMGIAQIDLPWFVGILVIVAVAALFPAVVALADCLADEVYRAILYETIFSALGGVVGLAAAWPLVFLQSGRTQVALIMAIYSAVIWFMMAVAKWEEESEEKLEARERQTGPAEPDNPAGPA